MNEDIIQLSLFVLVLVALVKPLGYFMSQVYRGQLGFGLFKFEPTEFKVYRWLG